MNVMTKNAKHPPAVHITLKLNVPVEQLKRIAEHEWWPAARTFKPRAELRGTRIGRLRGLAARELDRIIIGILETDYAPVIPKAPEAAPTLLQAPLDVSTEAPVGRLGPVRWAQPQDPPPDNEECLACQ